MRRLSAPLGLPSLYFPHTFISHFALAWVHHGIQLVHQGNCHIILTHVYLVTNGESQHCTPNRLSSFGCVQSKKGKRKRWVQTFLVVKGRNLQLSNKSLRLNPPCDWLWRATWLTLYEHELYAVVYSLVLPLSQQQTTLGVETSFLFNLI